MGEGGGVAGGKGRGGGGGDPPDFGPVFLCPARHKFEIFRAGHLWVIELNPIPGIKMVPAAPHIVQIRAVHRVAENQQRPPAGKQLKNHSNTLENNSWGQFWSSFRATAAESNKLGHCLNNRTNLGQNWPKLA